MTGFFLTLQVALGIGLVIFVHELGHFLAARWCGVKVEVFSLGFGPPLLRWRRGGTQYQLAAVPLGGFVKMLGEEPGETSPDDGETNSSDGDLRSKTVGQRFLIFSGGVIMNVIFALIVFPILFSVGVPFREPMLGEAIPGSPAWHARVEPGTIVKSLDGKEVFEFNHIVSGVALGDDDGAVMQVVRPGSKVIEKLQLEPRFDTARGIYTIGVNPGLDPENRVFIEAGSAADRAGVRNDDKLLGVDGGIPGLAPGRQFQAAMLQGKPIDLLLERDGYPVAIRLEPEESDKLGPPVLGIMVRRNHVLDVRDSEDIDRLGIRPGDRLLTVSGTRIESRGDLERVLLANLDQAEFIVQRDESSIRLGSIALGTPERALALVSDLALTEDLESTQIVVFDDRPGERAGLRNGDRIESINGVAVENWKEVRGQLQQAGSQEIPASVAFVRMENGEPVQMELEATLERSPIMSYGIGIKPATHIYKAASFPKAIEVGLTCSWRFMAESWATVKGMLFRRVDSDNIGGIITIGAVSYSWAQEGLAKLFFFLAMLSINLAFLNVLPIPVLDGGHLFFLLIEKLKGSPVSERVMGYSQMVGLVLILSLFVYVTYNDIQRLTSTFFN